MPEDPIGEIPTVLVDVDGRQYDVFTPEGGGHFDGDSVTLSAGPGVVPNLDIVGVRADTAGSASNIGQVHHRYTLGGFWYEVRAVDADGEPVSAYSLQSPLEVCVPLPPELSSNIFGCGTGVYECGAARLRFIRAWCVSRLPAPRSAVV